MSDAKLRADATPDTLREQVVAALRDGTAAALGHEPGFCNCDECLAERVLAVFAEHEDSAYWAGKETMRRVLRERIEALRRDAPSWYHVVPADRAEYGWDYALGKVLEMLNA